MSTIHIRQHFNAPIDQVFATVSSHHLFSEALAFMDVRVSQSNPSGLGSVRHMGFGCIKPLQEQVTVYQPPYRMQYQIVGHLSKLIAHHLGTVECLRQGDGTVVDYYVEFTAKPPLLSQPVLMVLKQTITQALRYHAKKMGSQLAQTS